MGGFGSILQGLSAGGKKYRQIKESDAAEQERLEDRLAQAEMRKLQKRTLEQALEPRPEAPVSWDRVETDDGIVQVNPRTGEVRPLMSGDKPIKPRPRDVPLEEVLNDAGERVYTPRSQAVGRRAPAPSGPAGSYTPMQGPDGRTVFHNPTTGETREAPENLTPQSAGGVQDKTKRSRAMANMGKALDGLEQTLTAQGSTVTPSVGRDVLQTAYQNTLLQAKELYELGVLNGPDYMIMQKLLRDPTSVMGRVESYGSSEEQTKRALAQLGEVRKIMGGLVGGTPTGKTVSPEDAERAKADPGFAAWLRKNGYQVP